MGHWLLAMFFACLFWTSDALSQPERGGSVRQPLPQAAAERPLYGSLHALVIGVSDYGPGWQRLPGVKRDVARVSRLLRELGFEVQEAMNPSYSELDLSLRRFVAEHGQGVDNGLLVFFAGHGHTVTTAAGSKLGYLVPADAPSPGLDPGGFAARAYSMQQIEDLARRAEAKHMLFLFDACFAGTIFRSRAGVPEAITQHTSRPVRQFITSGDESQSVPDESVFVAQLEAALRERRADPAGRGYVTGSQLGIYLQDTVTNYSRGTQTPQWGKIRDVNLDRGDFVIQLRPAARPSTASPGPASPAPAPVAGAQAAMPPLGPNGFRDCLDCPEMVPVPPGSFQMGARPATDVFREQSSPLHVVAIQRSFAIGRYEVSVGEFAAFVAATGFRTDAERGNGCLASTATETAPLPDRNWRNPGFAQTDTHPVVCMSRNDALAYIAWLNERARGKRYRLPSEAEWEYVARAGRGTARFPWGDDKDYGAICDFANGADMSAARGVPRLARAVVADCTDGHPYSAPAGALRPNAFGLWHVIGNVSEYVQDAWHPDYKGAPADGSAWMDAGDAAEYVVRGGSWANHPTYLDPAFRWHVTPRSRTEANGFRVARDL